jgi:hypothetical protein
VACHVGLCSWSRSLLCTVRVAPGWSRVISQDASSSVVLALHQPEDSRDPPPNWLPLTGPVVVEWERRLPHFRNGPRPRVI